jgi:hypothetical protein
MQQRKRSGQQMLLALALVLILVLAGCIEFHVRQQFYPNGRSTVLQQIPINRALILLKESGVKPPSPYDEDPNGWLAYIDSLCKNAGTYEPGAICHRLNDWLIIDQDRIPGEDYIFVSYSAFPYTIYELTVLKVPSPPTPLLEQLNVNHVPVERDLSHPKKEFVQQATQTGVKYEYFIIMPGEVLESSDGSVTPDGVKVDVMSQLQKRRPIRVRSRQIELEQLSILLTIPLSIFVLFDLVVLWAYRDWRGRREFAISRKKELQNTLMQERVAKRAIKLKGNEVYVAPELKDEIY